MSQWAFLNYKGKKTEKSPAPVFLHTATQIGAKFLVFGGCNGDGEAEGSLSLYDSNTFLWHSAPVDATSFQEDYPGPRYGHSSCLVDNHPPRVMIYGGLVGGDAFEFDAPNGLMEDGSGGKFGGGPPSPVGKSSWLSRTSNRKRKGVKSKEDVGAQDFDDRVYFVELHKEKWIWTKPLIMTTAAAKSISSSSRSSSSRSSSSDGYGTSANLTPAARAEHACCKTGTNEVSIFGGWTEQGPCNEFWAFDTNAMSWRVVVGSGIQPRARYRHTMECIDKKVYVLGGSDNTSDNAARAMHLLGVSVFDIDTCTWSHPELTGQSPFPRSAHSSALVGSMTLAVFGGRSSETEIFNDLYMIDLQFFTSTLVRCDGNMPSPVTSASMCAMGKRVFVFGGTDDKGYCFNDIRILDVGDYMNPMDTRVGAGAESEYRFKVLIIGDSGVGKSSLLTRFTQGTFLGTDAMMATVGIDYSSSLIMVDKSVCRLEMWDTAGQERFATMTANYYRGAQGALVVYDVSSRESFERAQVWFDRAKELGGADVCAALVGNKTDLADTATSDLLNTGAAGNGQAGRQVSWEDGHDLAAALGVPFVETSALNGEGVEEAFVQITRAIKASLADRGLLGLAAEGLGSAGGVSLAKGEFRRTNCC